MNIHEYQAKSLLIPRGVPLPPDGLCETAEEARAVACLGRVMNALYRDCNWLFHLQDYRRSRGCGQDIGGVRT